jgi:hypothetical protein
LATDPTSENNDNPHEGNLAEDASTPEEKASTGKEHKIVIEPTDGKSKFEWKSEYHPDAIFEIRCESIYLFLLLILSLVFLFTCWQGCLFSPLELSPTQLKTLRKYTFYASSGMLGGVVFGIKIFYRYVARGFWHQDRRIWRIMSPFLAMVLAFAIGVLIDANLFATRGPSSAPAFVSLGFLTGYFADQANAKMCEIAGVIFGVNGNKNSD